VREGRAAAIRFLLLVLSVDKQVCQKSLHSRHLLVCVLKLVFSNLIVFVLSLDLAGIHGSKEI
jgi:hypothetical protein